MLSLTEPLHDELIYKGHRLTLDLSFDVVLLWFDLLDSDLTEGEKIQQGFDNVVQSAALFTLEEKAEILQQTMDYVLEHTYGQMEENTVYKQTPVDKTRFFPILKMQKLFMHPFIKNIR